MAPTYGKRKHRVKVLQRECLEDKRAGEPLQANGSRYRELADLLPQTVFEIDEGGTTTYSNRYGLASYGYTHEDIDKGLNALGLFVPEGRERVAENIRKIVSGEESQGNEYTALRKDGTTFPVLIYSGPIISDGKPVGLRGVVIDMTERKSTEEALRASEERFRELAELLPTTIAEIDLSFHLTYMNKAGFETFGYSREDVAAGINVIKVIHPDDRQRARRDIKRVLQGKTLDGKHYKMLRKDGTELIILVHARPLHKKDGSMDGVTGTLTDITQIKRAKQALRQREEELQIKTRSLEEVNTALRVLLKRRDEDKKDLEGKVLSNVRELVVPFLEKLKATELDSKQRSYLEILESNLTDIISPFSRTLSTKYLNLTPKEIQVARLVREGKNTKEIAALMNLSTRTIDSHRKSIRKKMKLRDKKANLRTRLLSIK